MDTIYTEGRYLHGPDFDFLLYQADAHFLDLIDLDVFTHDKLEVGSLNFHLLFSVTRIKN